MTSRQRELINESRKVEDVLVAMDLRTLKSGVYMDVETLLMEMLMELKDHDK